MRTYLAYSRAEGPQEGAVLVLADTARQAKRLAWRSGECLNVDEYIDLAVLWLHDDKSILALVDRQKLAAGEAHVVAEPLACRTCGLWGGGVTEDGTCYHCGGDPGDLLVRLIREDEEQLL